MRRVWRPSLIESTATIGLIGRSRVSRRATLGKALARLLREQHAPGGEVARARLEAWLVDAQPIRQRLQAIGGYARMPVMACVLCEAVRADGREQHDLEARPVKRKRRGKERRDEQAVNERGSE